MEGGSVDVKGYEPGGIQVLGVAHTHIPSVTTTRRSSRSQQSQPRWFVARYLSSTPSMVVMQAASAARLLVDAHRIPGRRRIQRTGRGSRLPALDRPDVAPVIAQWARRRPDRAAAAVDHRAA